MDSLHKGFKTNLNKQPDGQSETYITLPSTPQ